MRITRIQITEQNLEAYKKYHDRVFAPDPGHIPALAYVATDDKGLIGFVAGYIHRAGTFYVSKMGVMPERRRQCNFYKPVWEKIRRDGFFTILGMIENTNRPVLLRMLRDGWMICGFRVIEDGKQLVEVIKWLKSDNNNQL